MPVSKHALSRLPLSRAASARMKRHDALPVFSCASADAIGVTPAPVRRDFPTFRFTCKMRAGYHVKATRGRIDLLVGSISNPLTRLVRAAVTLVFVFVSLSSLSLHSSSSSLLHSSSLFQSSLSLCHFVSLSLF